MLHGPFFGVDMEEKLKKKRIRKIALIAILIVAVAGIALSMNIERADYGKALGEEIEKAEAMLSEAETGYDKGQYLPEVVVEFQNAIETARSVFEDKDAVYDDQKAAYEKIKDDMENFKDAANEKDIPKKETKKKKEVKEEKEKQEDIPDAVEKKQGDNKSEKKQSEKKPEVKNESATEESSKIAVYIQIRCDNLVGNVEDKSCKNYVPSSGCILAKEKYECEDGTTVYDVLYHTCRNHNIQIEAEYTPVYNSYYVESLNHIYEFDGGAESGWMFRVNGGYPDRSCSSVKLHDGDSIVWAYTVNNGKDLGDRQ